ncbi:MAG: hypothetical protein PHY78_06340 [Desulfobacterales bacterium]|nr:hypothetical protein [Desulfobacterales bacterium]
MKHLLRMTSIAMLCVLTACGDSPAPDNAPKLPSDHPEISQEMPDRHFSGTVKEVLNVSEYTYCLIGNNSGTNWIAIPKTEIETGEKVSFSNGLIMRNFYSKSLDHYFDEVIFCAGIDGRPLVSKDKSAHGQMPARMPSMIAGKTCPIPSDASSPPLNKTAATMPHNAAGQNPAISFKDIKVEKVSGKDGFRISELYEKASELSEKNVSVRGNVVKILHNIMKKNWVHIQDGTGDPAQNTHDLVLNCLQTPSVGDTVTVSGRLKTDRDFGAGFTYRIIIEDASISN